MSGNNPYNASFGGQMSGSVNLGGQPPVGGDLVQEWGGEVKLAELLPGNSTTATVARIKG